MMPVSFSVCLHLGASSSRTFSLLPSRRFHPLYAVPPPSSEGGEATAAASRRIAKVRAAVKPADGGLSSSVTAQRKSAAPRHLPQGEGKGGCRRKATELQGCEPRLSPPTAGCPHPSRCSAKAQHRATFPKGKAKAAAAASHRFALYNGAKIRAQHTLCVSFVHSSA